MKFTAKIETRPMSFDILDSLSDSLQDGGLRGELESVIRDYLETLLAHQGLRGITIKVVIDI